MHLVVSRWGVIGLALCFATFITAEACSADTALYAVHLKAKGSIDVKGRVVLSPALMATLASGGTLVGMDGGRIAIVSAPRENVGALRRDPAVEFVDSEVRPGWSKVTKLKLSYEEGKRPADDELHRAGISVLEDYKPGSFLIAEPLNHHVDASVVDRIQQVQAITYATPIYEARSVQASRF
jgi:hypothetical protein